NISSNALKFARGWIYLGQTDDACEDRRVTLIQIGLFILLFWFPFIRSFARGEALGVLEQVPGVYAGQASAYRIRAIFHKDGERWKSFPSDCSNQECLKRVTSQYPKEIRWLLGFKGAELGTLVGRTPKDFGFYAQVGLQDIIGGDSVAKILRNGFIKYEGWDADIARPLLIANTNPYFSIPDGWSKVKLGSDTARVLQNSFRARFPALFHTSGKRAERNAYQYCRVKISVIKAYASFEKWVLADLRPSNAADCHKLRNLNKYDDSWFLLKPNEASKYLGSGMWLIGIGDYDNDGKPEFIFVRERRNQGGYELFYADFQKNATFLFVLSLIFLLGHDAIIEC
ncbi:hypothetical protein B2A_06322, partial [mine drainage metagenome]